MPQLCDHLLTADWLLTQDENRTVIQDAAIAISNGLIQSLGPRADIVAAYSPSRPENFLRLGLVMPGLINSHTHISMTLLRGLADDLPLMEWLTKHIFPVEQKLTPEMVEMGALLGCLEMISTGTTAFQDMYLMETAVARAVDATCMKAVLGEVIFGFPSPAYTTLDAGRNLVREMARSWRGHPRVRVAVKPHAIYTTDPDILGQCLRLAREEDLMIEIHLAETASETAQCLERFKARPAPYLNSLGLLGPRTLAAHVVDLDDNDIDILVNTKTRLAHMPESNMKLASGIARIPELLAKGAVIGLGADGAASNNNLNMFGEMASCARVHKVRAMDPTVMDSQTGLDLATLGGAQCLGWPELGSLIPGRPADLIALDLNSPNLQPMYNPVSHAVYAATGHEVCLTMIDGEILYRDGRFLKTDYEGLLKEIGEIRQWIQKHVL